MGQDQLASAREALERTEALAPGSVEAFLARGYYEYYGRSKFDAALSAFLAAERLAPSDAEVAASIGLILRRQGKWAESTEKMKKAVQLDPRNVTPLTFLAENLAFRGAFRAADAVVERGLTLAPASPALRSNKVNLLLAIDRSTDRADRLAAELALDPRRLEEAAMLATLAQVNRDYPRVVEVLDRVESGGVPLFEFFLGVWKARALLGAGDPAAVGVADSALVLFEKVSRQWSEGPAIRGMALAVAGRREEALRELDDGARRVRTWDDHVDPTRTGLYIVDAYGILGETDQGFALLDDLVDRPSVDLSVAVLQLQPFFDPYRGDPRFDELVARRKRFEADAAKMGEAGRPWVP
jgi:tetratricopeptide (TPR) repeat protein